MKDNDPWDTLMQRIKKNEELRLKRFEEYQNSLWTKIDKFMGVHVCTLDCFMNGSHD